MASLPASGRCVKACNSIGVSTLSSFTQIYRCPVLSLLRAFSPPSQRRFSPFDDGAVGAAGGTAVPGG